MKKIYSFLICLLFVGSVFAQSVTIGRATTAPEIDGYPDDLWEDVVGTPIDKPFRAEQPTIGNSWWKVLFDDDNFYVLVYCDDDNHYPAWVGGVAEHWNYDKPEIYFDVNAVLKDKAGAGTADNGHWQFAEPFLDGEYGIAKTVAKTGVLNGGTFAYDLDGTGYYYEVQMPYAEMADIDGNALDYATIKARSAAEGIGFDVTIIDQDEGVTTDRHRMVWMNDGSGEGDESWNNMDGIGIIKLDPASSKQLKINNMSVYPNPAVDNVTINADFNKVVISNILGQQIKSVAVKSKTISISDLSKGVYVIKAYKNDKYVGTAKITKN